MVRSARAAGAAVAVAFSIAAAPVRSAHAWVEVHVEADDVRVLLQRTGEARVEHKITLKIAGGPLRSFDVRGVDADAAPDPEGYILPEREAARGSLVSAVQAVAERLPVDSKPRPDGSPGPTVLRVRFDREKGLGRGVYVLFLRYATHVRPRREPREVLARMEWRGPIWDDGLDSARVTFDLPAAATEPRAADALDVNDVGGTSRPPLVLSTVHRGAERDQIELLRPYAPKGEAITWAIRADPRALKPPPATPPRPSGVHEAIDAALAGAARQGILGAGAAALFLFYGVLVALKSREASRFARAAGTAARPLVPLPAPVRAVLAGALLVVGVAVELLLSRATVGALMVLGAVALAAHRTPLWPRAALRRPGRWLPVPASVALADPPRPTGAYLDVSTRAGKALFLMLLAGVAALAIALNETSPYQAELVVFDVAALLAVFCTGRIAELPPDPAKDPARLLRDVARRVEKAFSKDQVRLVGRIRVPDGRASADELRLGVAPRATAAGFGAIEVGVVYVPGAGGALALPEVILRTKQGSACEAAMERFARHGRAVRGRSANERAVVFSPRLPTARMTAAILVRLLRALTVEQKAGAERHTPSRTRRAA
jgi:hypothetical protein